MSFERKDGLPKSAPEYNPIIKLQRSPTPGKAIKAMCAHCMGCTADHMEPGFKQAIRACTSNSCPLFAFRPYRAREVRA